jgi:hypothetical protein
MVHGDLQTCHVSNIINRMKDRRQLSHDILNILERFRIMHDLARDKNFENISKEELLVDLKDSLAELEKNFDELINTDQ